MSAMMLAQEGGGVHGGSENLAGEGLDIIGGELVDDGLRRPGSVVGDEGQAHVQRSGVIGALGRVRDPRLASEADAVQVE